MCVYLTRTSPREGKEKSILQTIHEFTGIETFLIKYRSNNLR